MKKPASVHRRFPIFLWLVGGMLIVASVHNSAALLEIAVFSGRPNPVVPLEQADLAHVASMLGEATPIPPQEIDGAFPPFRLGYRGVRVRRWPQDDPAYSLRIGGKFILLTSGEYRAWFRAADTKLERYLVDLADARGVIDDGLDQDIRLEIEKNSPKTLFLDDFQSPLNPIWSGALPSTADSWPDLLFSFAGPSGYRFETDGPWSILHLTNTLGSNERRGWSAATNFFCTDFRFEVRFRLRLRSLNGGVIELWVLDPGNPNHFVFTSLFGHLSAGIAFTYANSISGESGGNFWLSERYDVYYRLVLESAGSENSRTTLLTASGQEVFSKIFRHASNAFSAGFNIGFSQCGKFSAAPSELRPTEVAIDFVQLTGTDSAAADHRKTLYDFASWGGKAATHYDSTVKNWTPDFRSPLVTNFVLRAEGTWTNGQRAANYMFADPEDSNVLLRLRTWEGSNILSAHLAMLDQIGLLAGADPTPLPLASTIGLDLGDRSYLFGALTNAILFVRNNVFVYLAEESLVRTILAASAPARETAVRRIARLLDSQLAARGFSGPALLQPHLAAGGFHATVPTRVGSNYRVELKDSLNSSEWTAHTLLAGDGTIRGVTLPASTNHRFVRLRVE